MNARWKQKKTPVALEAKYEFDSYDILREFLDQTADLAEKLGHHPNLSFGRTHVSVIIYSQGEALQEVDIALAEGYDDCFQSVTSSTEGE